MRIYARMYMRVYDCQDSTGHGTRPEHTAGTHRRKMEDTGKTKFAIVGRSTHKKQKKVKKKFVNKEKGCIFVTEIKQQTSLTIKLQSNENIDIENLQE